MSGIVHPCKIYGALAISRPVLALGPAESYLGDILLAEQTPAQTKLGWTVQHGDVAGTVAALQAAVEQSPADRNRMSQRAHEVASNKFSRQHLLQQFLEALEL
jgi:hypothetical protein